MSDLSILSVNCRGLQGFIKRQQVFQYLKETHCDIFCLQDTHFHKDQFKTIYTEWGSKCILSFSSTNSRGVGVFLSNKLDCTIHEQISDENGNYVILDITISETRFTLVTLYGPNEDNQNFYEDIFNIIDHIGNDDCLICGDFNLVINPNLDYDNYKNINNKKARSFILNEIQKRELTDPYRINYPATKRFTWRRTNPLQQARLDFFLITPILLTSVTDVLIKPSFRSDHSMVILKLKFVNFEHGKGLWKHNNSLLKDLDYLKEINNVIDKTIMQYAVPVYEYDIILEI